MPISRQIDTIVESMMFMVTMSMGVSSAFVPATIAAAPPVSQQAALPPAPDDDHLR
jgi:hypothetical protein